MTRNDGASASRPGCEASPSAADGVFAESHPSREDAATDFDPDCCQWCGDIGFDLRGLAQHVWQRCDVVERLANENADDLRAWHQKDYEDHQRRKAEAARQAIEARSVETERLDPKDESAVPEGDDASVATPIHPSPTGEP